jgi:hypothetical protein
MPRKKTSSPPEPLDEVVPAPALEPPPSPAPVVAPPVQAVPALPADQKPGNVQIIATATLVNGIINLLWGTTLILVLLPTLFCWPVGAYPFVLGILEIVYAAKLLPNPPRPVQPATYLAVMEIVAILYLNPLALIGGILALVFYNDPQVVAYFARLNTSQRE